MPPCKNTYPININIDFFLFCALFHFPLISSITFLGFSPRHSNLCGGYTFPLSPRYCNSCCFPQISQRAFHWASKSNFLSGKADDSGGALHRNLNMISTGHVYDYEHPQIRIGILFLHAGIPKFPIFFERT